MDMQEHSPPVGRDGCGPLTSDDLEAVVEIDAAVTGQRRQRFLARRLARTIASPDRYVHMGLRRDGRLAGFALARLTAGEFGAPGGVAVLDALGVAPAHRGGGGGRQLLDAVVGVLRRKGVRELATEVDWIDHRLLHFFARTGFELAPRLVLERAVGPVPDL